MHNYLCLEQKMEERFSEHPPRCREWCCSNRNKSWGGGFREEGGSVVLEHLSWRMSENRFRRIAWSIRSSLVYPIGDDLCHYFPPPSHQRCPECSYIKDQKKIALMQWGKLREHPDTFGKELRLIMWQAPLWPLWPGPVGLGRQGPWQHMM